MPSKKIQLRGISRLPSDRMTTDGGLSVSLNAQLENDENASMVRPDDLTGRMGAGDHHIPEFLHRMTSVKNILMLDYNRKNLYYAKDKGRVSFDVSLISAGSHKTVLIKAIMDATGMGLREVKSIVDNAPVQDAFSFDTREEADALVSAITEAGGTADINDKTVAGGGDTLVHNFGSEKVLDIQSMGNTIAVRTTDHMHYIKWKDGEYHYLGTKIPEAYVKFTTEMAGAENVSVGSQQIKEKNAELMSMWNTFQSKSTAQAKADYLNEFLKGGTNERDAVIQGLNELLWGAINIKVRELKADGKFCYPIMARSALVLYDGAYFHQSAPQLLGDGMVNQQLMVTADGTGIQVAFRCIHTEKYQVKMPDADNWRDIIRSVKIGLSTDICNPSVNASISRAEVRGGEIVLIFDGQSDVASSTDMEKEMLSKSLFYVVDEKNMEVISDTYDTATDINPLGQDELVLKDEIPDDELSHHEVVPVGEVMSYNGKFVFSGVKSIIYAGHPFLCSKGGNPTEGNRHPLPSYDSLSFEYWLRDGDGNIKKVVALNDEGGLMFQGNIGGWLYYPDPRCFKVKLTTDTGKEYLIAMKEHPGLNGAYASYDMTCGILYGNYGSQPAVSAFAEAPIEDRTITEKNKVYMTKAFNPFVYPTETRYSFQYDIIKVVPTTLALSQNQFMAHELYVFTSGGIWTMKLGDNGNSYQVLSLSRDIAATPDLIIPIEQAVVFATDSAINIIREGQVTSISPYMNGEHYTLSGERDLGTPSCSGIISGIEEYGEGAAEILTDDTPFMEFMENARCTYDSYGRRLIFFNEKKLYQYVFCLDSATWHTMTLELSDLSGLRFVRTLNSYPDALVSMRSETNGRLIDMSTHYGRNMADTETMPSLIITRPFNLEEVDILKSITDVRIRGKYNAFQKRVSFMLQGSQDGINFHRLSSLRGKSWKVFRMVILARLKPEERISYVEIEYEPRFGNRLR